MGFSERKSESISGNVMGFLSHRVEVANLEAGDHIYTWRTGFAYSHHGFSLFPSFRIRFDEGVLMI